MADLKAIAENLIKGQAPKVKELVQAAVNEGVSPQQILSEGLIAGMNVVGTKFKANEFYIPEVLIAARAMHAGMGILKPLLAKSGAKAATIFAIGTVKGDLHDIGKNLVSMMMEGAGFDVIDIGIDVPNEKFIEVIKDKKPAVLGLSALLTTTMPAMKSVVDSIKAAGLKDSVKIIIGGAPITQSYADEIGADGYAADAASAVDISKKLLGK
ncbi:MAG: methyltransferase [Elusimicrobia bacterium RIFOXYA2_FULL_40_6]|nr:MAG: methyltransferase [Elusimicrobia bacterium RIFOXYA2_FULL_40_6]